MVDEPGLFDCPRQEPTDSMWPLLESDAVRIDAIDLSAEEQGPMQVRVSWMTVKIPDAAAVRELATADCSGHRAGRPGRDRAEFRGGLAVGGAAPRADDRDTWARTRVMGGAGRPPERAREPTVLHHDGDFDTIAGSPASPWNGSCHRRQSATSACRGR